MPEGKTDRTRAEPPTLPQRAQDDSDLGWGELTETDSDQDPDAVERRYREERPPHHGN